jgi:hypothetical protein
MWLSVFICHCYYPNIKEEAYISIYVCAKGVMRNEKIK